ncbi:MAG: DUF1223 domain-containing protein, partial [Hyphomonadaceae bacterium]
MKAWIALNAWAAALAFGSAALFASPSAFAQTQDANAPMHRTGSPIVVELYTSQGCFTCRRANRLLGEIASDPDVIALTFPVDYWDYLGWHDTFARDEFTRRQRRFWLTLHIRSLYTPGILINGERHVNGAREPQVRALLQSFRTAPMRRGPNVAIRQAGRETRVEIGRGSAPAEPADIWIVTFDPGPEWVTIQAGDNRGQRMAHYNLVRTI